MPLRDGCVSVRPWLYLIETQNRLDDTSSHWRPPQLPQASSILLTQVRTDRLTVRRPIETKLRPPHLTLRSRSLVLTIVLVLGGWHVHRGNVSRSASPIGVRFPQGIHLCTPAGPFRTPSSISPGHFIIAVSRLTPGTCSGSSTYGLETPCLPPGDVPSIRLAPDSSRFLRIHGVRSVSSHRFSERALLQCTTPGSSPGCL